MCGKCTVNQCISHMIWFSVYKIQEEGWILTAILLQKVFAAAEFWTSDLPTQIFFALQPHLPWEDFIYLEYLGFEPGTYSFHCAIGSRPREDSFSIKTSETHNQVHSPLADANFIEEKWFKKPAGFEPRSFEFLLWCMSIQHCPQMSCNFPKWFQSLTSIRVGT